MRVSGFVLSAPPSRLSAGSPFDRVVASDAELFAARGAHFIESSQPAHAIHHSVRCYGPRRRRSRTMLIPLALAVALQSASPAPAQPAPGDEIIVQGMRVNRQQVRDFIRAVTDLRT